LFPSFAVRKMEEGKGVTLPPNLSEPFGNTTAFSAEWQPQVTPTGPSSLFMPISSALIPSTLPVVPLQVQQPPVAPPKKAAKKKPPTEAIPHPEEGEQSQKEGSNIHFAADGKKLCSYSHKLCKQRRMEGRSFCIKHILEDPTSGIKISQDYFG